MPEPNEADQLSLAVQGHLALGELAKALRTAEAGCAVARAAGDRRGEAAAQEMIAGVHAAGGAHAEAAAAAREAMNLYLALEDRASAGRSLLALCESLVSAGEAERALEESGSFRALARSARDGPAEALALQAACLAHYERWQLEECLGAAREAQALFERAGQPLGQAQALSTIAEVRLTMGAGHDTARRAAQKALKLFKEAGPGHEYEGLRALMAECQAHIYLLLEHPVHIHTAASWAEALKAACEAEELARAFGDSSLAASALCMIAQVQSATQRGQAAIRAARGAADLYRECGGPLDVARALLFGAEAALVARRRKEARQMAAEAMALAREAGDADAEALAQAAFDNAGEEAAEVEAYEGQPGAGPELKEALALSIQDASSAPQRTLADLMLQVLALDISGGPLEETPLMEPGLTGPMRPMGHEQFLHLGGGAKLQASAVLALMRYHAEATARCRPMRPQADGGEGQGGRRHGDGGSAAWVAPVRKRLEKGVHWRPPDARQGFSFGALPRRAL